MSRNAVQVGYFSSVENNENHDAAQVRVKGGEARETRLPVQGKRTVLGTLTNKPLTNVSLKPKQVKTTLLIHVSCLVPSAAMLQMSGLYYF